MVTLGLTVSFSTPAIGHGYEATKLLIKTNILLCRGSPHKSLGMILGRWLSVNCMSTLYPADEPW